MTRPLPPSQRDVEAAQRDLFLNGDMKAIAAHLDVDRSYVSRLLSPEDSEHRSPFYTLVRWLYACDMHREELGDGHVSLLNQFRNAWRGTKETDQGRVVQLVHAVNDQMIELLSAQVNALPYAKRLQFIDKALGLLDDFKRDMQLNGIEDSPVNIRGKRA